MDHDTRPAAAAPEQTGASVLAAPPKAPAKAAAKKRAAKPTPAELARRKFFRAYRLDFVHGSIWNYSVGSFTRDDLTIVHHPSVEVDGHQLVRCTCEDFQIRHERFWPTLHDAADSQGRREHWCKHIRDVVQIMQQDRVLAIGQDGLLRYCGRHKQRVTPTLQQDGKPPRLPEVYFLAAPRNPHAAAQLFAYADCGAIPDTMQLLSVRVAATPEEAVAGWFRELGLEHETLLAVPQPGVTAWEIQRAFGRGPNASRAAGREKEATPRHG